MKNYNAKKDIFDKFSACLTSDNFAGGILKALLAANF